ncbi:MAG: bacillithiol biosynthesis deacetylase BshB1 [Bacteroidota bacterium]
MTEYLHILVFAAHPDDAELGCAGTILKHVALGQKVGIIDLTRGELGTRGTAEIRDSEAEAAGKILGLSVRENMEFRDGFFNIDEAHKLALIAKIRQYRPEIVIANALYDRHTDHGRGGTLVSEACFLSGLAKIETLGPDGSAQQAWRPKVVYRYIQDRHITPDFVIDITEVWEKKKESILAYGSQFFNPNSTEPETYISGSNFLKFIEGRAMEYGHAIGVTYGEGFNVERKVGVNNLDCLI